MLPLVSQAPLPSAVLEVVALERFPCELVLVLVGVEGVEAPPSPSWLPLGFVLLASTRLAEVAVEVKEACLSLPFSMQLLELLQEVVALGHR